MLFDLTTDIYSTILLYPMTLPYPTLLSYPAICFYLKILFYSVIFAYMLIFPGCCVGYVKATPLETEIDTKHNVLIDLETAEIFEAERKLRGLDSRVRTPPTIQDCVKDDE